MELVPYHPGMMCGVRDVFYDYVARWGGVITEEFHCTDMTGCIAFFVRLDPRVERIEVRDGLDDGSERQVYRRVGDSWISEMLRVRRVQ